jgi:phage terminase small subunit
MPHRSRASLAVIPPVVVPHEPPPACLAPEEAAEWRRVVESLPARWFPGASFTLLELYCRAVANARWLAVQTDAHARGSPDWQKWHRLYGLEVKQCVQLATRLRLHPRWERTTVRKVPSSPRPWDKPPAA